MHCIVEENEKQHFDKKSGSATHIIEIIIYLLLGAN